MIDAADNYSMGVVATDERGRNSPVRCGALAHAYRKEPIGTWRFDRLTMFFPVEWPESSMDRIAENRASRRWSRRELAGRLAWAMAWPLFRFSPKLAWGWRRCLLRLFGAKIGRQVHIHPSVKVFIPWNLTIGDWSSIGFDALMYNLGPLEIGRRVTISQRAHLCGGTHDHRDPTMPLVKTPIWVGDDAWVCADAFIGPGVSIGRNAIVAARAVVVRDVNADEIVGGNPATKIAARGAADE